MVPALVTCVSTVPAKSFARPKSNTLAVSPSRPSEITMFSGLRSRCTMPAACASSTDPATWAHKYATRPKGIGPSLSRTFAHMNGVGMIEARRGLRLAMKPGDVLGILLQLRVQQLDRHHLADLHVLGAIDHPHRPTPYRRHHPIPVGDDVARLEHVGDQRRAALPTELRLRRVALPTFVAAHLVVWRRARHSTSEVDSRAKLPRER